MTTNNIEIAVAKKRENFEKIEEGIITQIHGETKYTFWHIADIVKPYIAKFLENVFLDSIVIKEFHKIDYVILQDIECLPVEIQSTQAYKNGINHSGFEQKIEKQLKQNIVRYGKGVFFFDSDI